MTVAAWARLDSSDPVCGRAQVTQHKASFKATAGQSPQARAPPPAPPPAQPERSRCCAEPPCQVGGQTPASLHVLGHTQPGDVRLSVLTPARS